MAKRKQSIIINILFIVCLSAIILVMDVVMISQTVAQRTVEPIIDVLESQRDLNEALVERPDICGLIDVQCPGEKPVTIEDRIEAYALQYNVDASAAVLIAACESSLNPYAENDHSTAKGLYQFTDRTWRYIKADGHQFDVDENIKQFMIWYPVHPEWWVCE